MPPRTVLLLTYTRHNRARTVSRHLDALIDDLRQSPECLGCEKSRRADGAWQLHSEWQAGEGCAGAHWERLVLQLQQMLSLRR